MDGILDIRWKQRLDNWNRAFAQWEEFLALPGMNKFELQGYIQCYEYNFELAWKTMKDWLEAEGFEVNSPRSAIQTAFAAGLISDGAGWIDALEKRNLMAHSYDEARAQEAKALITDRYYPLFVQLIVILRNKAA